MASFFDFPSPFRFKKMTGSRRNTTRTSNGRSTVKRPFPRRRSASRTRSFKKVRFTKKRKKSTTVKTLSKRVTKLAKSVDQGLALLTHRHLSAGQFLASAGKQLTKSFDLNNQGILNNSLSIVPYFDSSTNTIIDIDASDNLTTYQRDYLFKYQGATVILKNNYTVPCVIKAAIVRPKNDTSVTPSNAWLAGLADIGSFTGEELQLKWSDSQVYMDMWTNIVMKKTVLQPGQELVLHADLGSLKYQPQTAEADSLSYRVNEKPASLMITVMGEIAHDSVDTTQMSTTRAGVDFKIEVIRKIEYDAGLSIKRIRLILDNFQTAGFTNTGTIAAKPVAAYQNYDSSVF